MIGEARATKEVIDDAYDGIQNAAVASSEEGPPIIANNKLDNDLFGFSSEPQQSEAPASLASNFSQQENRQLQPGVDNNQQVVGGFYQQPETHLPAPHVVEPEPPAPTTEPAQGAYSVDAPIQQPAYNQPDLSRPAEIAHHNRNSSVNSAFGTVMGGDITPLPGTDVGGAQEELPPTLEEVEALKSKAREASSIAEDAESSRRQMVEKSEELRKAADAADIEARKYLEKPEKKKKRFGRGNKSGKEKNANSVRIRLKSVMPFLPF